MGTLLLPLVLLVMFAPGAWTQAVANPELILNINCGATQDIVDPETGLMWYADDKYVDSTGFTSVNVPRYFGFPQLESLRFFNDSRVSKYCYKLPVTSNQTYMVRADFNHGGYDYPRPMASFQMSLDGLIVAKITGNASVSYYSENTYLAQGNATFLCLLRDITNTVPFISTISVRRIKPYPTMLDKHLSKGYVVKTRNRFNFGATTDSSRYPKDVYDRYWQIVGENQPGIIFATLPLSTLVTARSILYSPSNPRYDTVPMVVLQSALTSAGNMTLTLRYLAGTKGFLILHFAELGPAVNVTSREFTFKPGSAAGSKVNIRKTAGLHGTGFFWDNLVFRDPWTETVEFAPAPGSAYGPFINALEFFNILPDVAPVKTVNDDAFAIEHIKSSLKLADWTGDPCLPVPHSWVLCSSLGPPTIETVNLDKFNLSGPIPMEFNELPKLSTLILSGNNFDGLLTDLSLLKNLRVLQLQDNNLTGPLPAWLGQLPLLKELYVQNNNFNSSIPPSLLSKNGLDFKYRPGNPLLIVGPAPEKTKKPNIWVIIGPILGVGFVAILAAAAIIFYCCVYKKRPSSLPVTKAPPAVELGESRAPQTGGARNFSVAAIAAATQNFWREIGKGGFGPVYYGKLPSGEEVAVKVLDRNASTQGAAQFFNEVDVLSKVHHRNLVSLLGFCNEGENRMLVYEYLPQGSLRDRLNASPRLGVLDFKARVNIALNAAQGLDYLHTGCNPGIVHRDVKSTNILLTGTKDVAKVGDFGLSRLAPGDADDGSITIVQGTRGYIDPEYVNSNVLTTKSDVFSFGVVLLELLTGRLPLPPSSASANHAWTLCGWVRTTLQSGSDATHILDPELRLSAPNAETLWIVADLAMRCVEPKSVHRPSMADVVQELRTALQLEDDGPSSAGNRTQPTSSGFLERPVQQSDDSNSGTFSTADMSWPAPR